MFTSPLSLNIGTDAAPVEILPVRINDQDYSSEYRLKDGENHYTFRIRHQTEKTKVKSSFMERHNVTITYNEAPTEAYPLGRTYEVYSVIRAPSTVDSETLRGLAQAALGFTLANVESLVNWDN